VGAAATIQTSAANAAAPTNSTALIGSAGRCCAALLMTFTVSVPGKRTMYTA
jgi:hypothetical protein